MVSKTEREQEKYLDEHQYTIKENFYNKKFITLPITLDESMGWTDKDREKVHHYPNTRMGKVRRELRSLWNDIKGASFNGTS